MESISNNSRQKEDFQLQGRGNEESRTELNEIMEESKGVIIQVKNYQWSDQQNRKYYHFLSHLKDKLTPNNPQRKVSKVNVQMSKFVKTRTSLQCRSHNQKMLHRFGSLDNIIEYFREYFERKDTVGVGIQAKQAILNGQERENTLQYQQATRGKEKTPWPLTCWDLKYSLPHHHPPNSHNQLI